MSEGQLKQQIETKKRQLLDELFPEGDSAWREETQEDMELVLKKAFEVLDTAKSEYKQIDENHYESTGEYIDALRDFIEKWVGKP